MGVLLERLIWRLAFSGFVEHIFTVSREEYFVFDANQHPRKKARIYSDHKYKDETVQEIVQVLELYRT